MPEHVRKILSDANRGRVKTKEQKEKWKAKMVGRFSGENNPMFGVRLTGQANHFHGKTHSEETKKHWSEIRTGRKQSAATSEKKRQTMRKVWASRSTESREAALVGLRKDIAARSSR